MRSFILLFGVLICLQQYVHAQPALVTDEVYSVYNETTRVFTPTSRISRQYDVKGRTVWEANFSWDDKMVGYRKRSEARTEYQNEQVKELVSTYYRENSDTIAQQTTTTNIYREDGLRSTQIIREQSFGSKDIFGTRWDYTYDNLGCMTMLEVRSGVNESFGGPANRVEFTYVSGCRILEMKQFITVGTPYIQVEKNTYGNDLLTEKKVFVVIGEDTTITRQSIFEYDEQGRMISDTWAGYQKSLWVYEGKLLLSTETLYWDGTSGAWKRASLTTYNYGDDARVLKQVNDYGFLTIVTEYEYNPEGSIKSVLNTYSQVLQDQSIISNQTESLYSYRCDGQLFGSQHQLGAEWNAAALLQKSVSISGERCL